jgi:hypothetical protein
MFAVTQLVGKRNEFKPGPRLKKQDTGPNPQLLQSRKNFSFGPVQQQGRVEQRAIAVQPDMQTRPP